MMTPYYLVTDALLVRQSTPEAEAMLQQVRELRAKGREAVILYWPEEKIYTIAAESRQH